MKKIHLCIDFGWPEDKPGLAKCGRTIERGDGLVFRRSESTCWSCKTHALKDIGRRGEKPVTEEGGQ